MKKQRNLLFFILSFCCLAFIENKKEHNQKIPKNFEVEKLQKQNQLDSLSKNYKSIFNNKDLSGWIVYGTEKWYVENGLAHNQIYCDYSIYILNLESQTRRLYSLFYL